MFRHTQEEKKRSETDAQLPCFRCRVLSLTTKVPEACFGFDVSKMGEQFASRLKRPAKGGSCDSTPGCRSRIMVDILRDKPICASFHFRLLRCVSAVCCRSIPQYGRHADETLHMMTEETAIEGVLWATLSLTVLKTVLVADAIWGIFRRWRTMLGDLWRAAGGLTSTSLQATSSFATLKPSGGLRPSKFRYYMHRNTRQNDAEIDETNRRRCVFFIPRTVVDFRGEPISPPVSARRIFQFVLLRSALHSWNHGLVCGVRWGLVGENPTRYSPVMQAGCVGSLRLVIVISP